MRARSRISTRSRRRSWEDALPGTVPDPGCVDTINRCRPRILLFVTCGGIQIGWKLHQRKRRLVNRWFFEILRLAFRDLQRDAHGTNSIYGREIGRFSFALLVTITVPAILSACFITFWNTYMVEEQIGTNCNANYDCFPIQDGEALQHTPVQNCSQWPEDTEYKCYQLVYSYVRGVSATGGILFFASVMLKIYVVTLLAPQNIQNIFCKWLCYSLVIIGGSLVALFFILLHMAIPHPKEAVFQTATYKIQFVVYSFVLFVVFSVSGPLLIYGIECEPHRQKKKQEVVCMKNPV